MLQSPRIIIVRSLDGSEFKLKVKDHVRLKCIFYAYAAAKALDVKDLRFMHDGCILNWEWTCGEIDMEPGDVIQVAFEQGGD